MQSQTTKHAALTFDMILAGPGCPRQCYCTSSQATHQTCRGSLCFHWLPVAAWCDLATLSSTVKRRSDIVTRGDFLHTFSCTFQSLLWKQDYSSAPIGIQCTCIHAAHCMFALRSRSSESYFSFVPSLIIHALSSASLAAQLSLATCFAK